MGADLPKAISGLPSRSDLARELADRYGVTPSSSLAEVASRVSSKGGRFEIVDFIRNALNPPHKSPQTFHQEVAELVKGGEIKVILTTAYDDLLEEAFRGADIRYNRVINGVDVPFIRPTWPTLIKLYGDAEQPDSLVVTDRDHSNLLRDREKEALVDEVRRTFRNNTILFIGYNLADPDFRFLFDQIAGTRFARTAYAVWPGLPEEDIRLWHSQGIVILDSEPSGIVDELAAPETAASDEAAMVEPGSAVDTAAIRQLLFDAFNDEELNAFCFDYFLPLYQDFTQGMSKSDKIQRLLDYSMRHNQIDRLLELVEERNPAQFERYKGET